MWIRVLLLHLLIGFAILSVWDVDFCLFTEVVVEEVVLLRVRKCVRGQLD
jgi:hypothetical protein